MANLRSLPLCVLAGSLFLSTTGMAQQPASAVRIAGPIDESQLLTLKGNTNPHAIAKYDRGPVSPSLSMPDLTLVLSRSPEQQAAFDAYVQGEYEEGSPDYHQWLTPDEIGARFGPAQADIATITNWLTGHGFAIVRIAKDGMTIKFSGTAAQVESTFHTQIHNLQVNGVPHYANMTDPQIPAALAPVVVGVKALHNFLPRPLHKMGSTVTFNKEAGRWQRVVNTAAANFGPAGSKLTPAAAARAAAATSTGPRPLFGINVPGDQSTGALAYLEEDVTPWDFATIYNVQPLWTSGITGTGQTIAIAGTSDIDLSDVSTFRSTFGLPAGSTPTEIDTKDGPAATECTSTTAPCGIGDLEENTLDVEWSGAVATGAQIDLVVTGQNSAGSIDTVYDSADYVVENLTAKILNVSYGECELVQGTAENVAYYELWQSAAAEGISVFVAAGDSGSPSCDDDGDSIGNPYSAQFGLSVSGIASTPYNVAVGGTDFSWCQPVYNSSGSAITGCATSSTSQGSPAYWNTSNNTTTEPYESAAGYVPETPWNDTCLNPIIASFVENVAPLVVQVTGAATPTSPEGTCNYIQNNWASIYEGYEIMLAHYVDTVGGSGGASNCVANDGENTTSCNTATTTGTGNGSIPLYNDGWEKPSWQTGVSGIPSDGVRDLPDVSFFAGDGTLDSAYLVCVSAIGSCSYSATSENIAEEAGGTSFASPAMAGVMALINQKEKAPQGLPNAQLYQLAGRQNYSSCSAEGPPSASCYFHSIDQGTNAMPCDLGASIGGTIYEDGNWEAGPEYAGVISPNCAALNAGDSGGIGTLVSSGTTPAYNATPGFNLATGLGSMNVANVVNAWTSDAGTAPATVTATLSASTIPANTALTVTVTVTGASGTPTGTVVVTGGGANANGTLSGGSATINIAANSLAVGSDTLTITYSGDSTYASASTTATVTVTAVVPTVAVTAVPTSQNVANALSVTVTVSGPLGSSTPTGTVTLAGGGYSSTAMTLTSSGTASFNIPAGALAAGTDTLTATYSGNSSFAGATGTVVVTIVNTSTVASIVNVTPAPTGIDSSQPLSVTMTVSGSGTAAVPTGFVTLTASGGSYSSGTVVLTSGSASVTIPANTLSAGTVTLTAVYSGDATYAAGSGTATVTVTQSAYALAATTPASVSPGTTATSTITGTQGTTDYTGTVTLSSCTLTTSPTNAANLPTCSVTGTIDFASGTPSLSGTATVLTSANTAMLETAPGTKGWLGAGGGAVLAFLVFLGIPARRRSWRAMLGLLVLLAALGSLTACGGGSVTTTTTSTATTAGAYTFTVSGTGSDPAKTTGTGTFTLTVN